MIRGLPQRWLGRVPFLAAVGINQEASRDVARGGAEHLLLFEPSFPLYTLGRRASTPQGRQALAATIALCESRGIPVAAVDRGGLGTLHLPGQLVVFVACRCERPLLRGLVSELLHAAGALSATYGVGARVELEADVGLWGDQGKIASIGLYESGGIARHGLAVNVAIAGDFDRGLALCGSAATRLQALTTPQDAQVPAILEDAARRFAAATTAPSRGHAHSARLHQPTDP